MMGGWGDVSAVAGTLIVIALPLSAQTISGTILSTDGVPVPSALVVDWDAVGERVRGAASPTGHFSLDLPEGAEPGVLNVRAIGYYPESVQLRGRPTIDLVVHLKPYAVSLPEVTARLAESVCPNRESVPARELWEAVRGRYQLSPVDSGWTAEIRLSTEQVGPEQVGRLEEDRLAPGVQGVAGIYRASAEAFMRDSGYAASRDHSRARVVVLSAMSDHFANWWYPSLDRWDVEHWLRDSFGARHALSLKADPDGSFTLTFCGRKGDAATVEGEMVIASDSTLRRVDWVFKTRGPDEKAGGEVAFVPVKGFDGRRLVPVSSVAWRLVAGQKNVYLQDAATYSNWWYKF